MGVRTNESDPCNTEVVSKRHYSSVTPSSIVELAAGLGHEREGLLQAVAAMQLIPDNATKWIRFERLLEAASGAVPEVEQRPVTPNRLRALLTRPPIASPHILTQEDPFEEPFTAAITFYGGTSRVVMGGASAANAGCQLVLEAALILADDSLVDYRTRVMRDARVLLTLSELMCARAGLARWAAANRSPRAPLVVPPQSELLRLARCATFTDDELTEALGPTVIAGNCYRLLARKLPRYELATPDRVWRHFIDTTGTVVVNEDHVGVDLALRTYTPVLIDAGFPELDIPIPWWGGRTLRFGFPPR